jgi:dimethylaniline monooxygenase (N-oxide forming)
MSQKNVVIIGAGPCGLVALKEMREAGHAAVALEKGPGIGGVFCRTHDTSYENLYLTISNMLMAFSDFPPEDLRLKYSSKEEYGAYLEAYADAFGLRPHVRLNTDVTRAVRESGRWRITIRRAGAAETEVIEADALIVATGSNHVPRRIALEGFEGQILHSSDYHAPGDFAGTRVLVVGGGESAFDIAADISGVTAETTVWSRSPLAASPRFVNWIWQDPDHDELETMKDEARWSRAKISEFLESMTTSRMANAAPLWAYSTIRHLIFAALSVGPPAARRLTVWNRQNMDGEPLRGDQSSTPTKSARLCTAAARGKVNIVVAAKAMFEGRDAVFADVLHRETAGKADEAPRDAKMIGIDVVVLCTGYQTDFSWLDVEGLDWNPRTWFKHCFPARYGDALMFLGWARPHQGGIPACAEMLARYAAMILAGTRSLPADYAERALSEGADEHAYYVNDQHSPNLVDYPAFMDSVARLIGCLPDAPSPSDAEKLAKYWIYPNWPLWYRMNGPGARPEIVDTVLARFPILRSFAPNPFNALALAFSIMQAPVGAVVEPRSGLRGRWAFKAKKHILHGNVPA